MHLLLVQVNSESKANITCLVYQPRHDFRLVTWGQLLAAAALCLRELQAQAGHYALPCSPLCCVKWSRREVVAGDEHTVGPQQTALGDGRHLQNATAKS